MAITRSNILTNPTARQQYARGVNLLKNEFTGPTTTSLGISGPSRPVSTYRSIRRLAPYGHVDHDATDAS